MQGVEDALAAAFANIELDQGVVVAFSGGMDSTVLLHACHHYALTSGHTIKALHVDHQLQKHSSDWQRHCQRFCAALEIKYDSVQVDTRAFADNGPEGSAREARYQAFSEHLQAGEVLLTAHHADDQVETLFLRLLRGAGNKGLVGCVDHRQLGSGQLLRPLLEVSQQTILCYAEGHHLEWCDDPSNEDPAFMRVRMRQAAPDLDALGLTSLRLAKTATRMGYVQEALEYSMRGLWPQVAQIDVTDVLFDREALSRLPREYVERMVSDALNWISGQPYRPRNSALLRAIAAKKTATLHGCVLIPQPENLLRISREFSAVEGVVAPAGTTWDGRISITKYQKSYEIRALGPSGLAQCPQWRESGRPRLALLASPSLWQGETLLAAPMAHFGPKDLLKVVSPPWE